MTTLPEFLTAKRTVEDRALNRRVWDRFVTALAGRTSDENDPVRIVEIGAGTGSMVARLADWAALPPVVSYRAVDLDADTVDIARQQLPEQLRAAGYAVEERADRLVATRSRNDTDQRIEISVEAGDGFAIDDEADAVIAAAVLDLVDLRPAVADLKGILADGGLLYAPFTFNGHTSFVPRDSVDDRIERLYHRHMDEVRAQPGSSRAGQQLVTALPAAGYTLVEAGGADWLVRPVDGGYPAAESTALEHLLSTIDGALSDYPPEVIEPSTRTEWIERRRDQLSRGELTLVAHHLDVLARL